MNRIEWEHVTRARLVTCTTCSDIVSMYVGQDNTLRPPIEISWERRYIRFPFDGKIEHVRWDLTDGDNRAVYSADVLLLWNNALRLIPDKCVVDKGECSMCFDTRMDAIIRAEAEAKRTARRKRLLRPWRAMKAFFPHTKS